MCDSNQEINLEVLKERLIDQFRNPNNDTPIKVVGQDLTKGITKDALATALDTAFQRAQSVLRKATGIAIIKGRDIVTKEEIEQAEALELNGNDHYLPPTGW